MPQNLLAEAIVLWHLFIDPQRVDQHQYIGGLLWNPGHGRIYEAMRHVDERRPGYFELAVYAEIRQRWPNAAERLIEMTFGVVDDWLAWERNEHVRDWARDEWQPLHRYSHGFEWWLKRLHECVVARRLVALHWRRVEELCDVDYQRNEAEADPDAVARQALADAVLNLD